MKISCEIEEHVSKDNVISLITSKLNLCAIYSSLRKHQKAIQIL